MTPDHANAAPLVKWSELWSLCEDVNVELEPGDGPVLLRSRWGDVTIQQPSQLVSEALRRMRLGPISLKNVISARKESDADYGMTGDEDSAQRVQLHRVLERLQPLIIRSLRLESGQPLLSVVPLTVQSRFHLVPLDADVP